MRALIVYESMFGNTHEVADHIGVGLGSAIETASVPVDRVEVDDLSSVDLLVVGGPTHVHGMTSAMSRRAAVQQAEGDNALDLDPGAETRSGLRDWLVGLPGRRDVPAAAFDTRADSPAALTGRASKGIARRLRRHGFEVIAEPESFVVDSDNQLLSGEHARAEEWGRRLAVALADRSGVGGEVTP